jgi:NAD+ synthase
MADTLTIALAQINLTLGDLDGNEACILKAYQKAAALGADVVITPELSISGYQPEDLVQHPSYMERCRLKVEALAAMTRGGPDLIVGAPWKSPEARPYNAAILLRNGKIAQFWYKYDLPNYSVFDDKRIFAPGDKDEGEPVIVKGARIGVAVCEDLWSKDKAASLAKKKSDILVSINASPYEIGKEAQRRSVIAARIKETGLPVAYVNQLGGQDEIIFDGGSFVMDAQGSLSAYFGAFEEKIGLMRFTKQGKKWVPQNDESLPLLSEEESIYSALVLGMKEYIEKNYFSGALIGLSGGIDSAFVAALAVDALGKDRVITVMMPSPYTSQESLEEAKQCAQRLGCEYRIIPIKEGMTTMDGLLKEHFKGGSTDIAEQNIQSRLRGLILMTLSNVNGYMVLATGNKSEMATGYCTLYGDMCGGYAPIKDVYKTLVYRLARWRNQHRPKIGKGPAGEVIPERTITRAPTAELKPNQVDQDTLPPYEKLDDILQGLVEKEMPVSGIVARGHEEGLVRKVLRMLRMSEYKRRQAPPGTKVTARAFGRDRRYPITNRFQQ